MLRFSTLKKFKIPKPYLKSYSTENKPKKVSQSHLDSEIGYKAVISSLKGNLFITTIKFGAYLVSGSAALLAETFHSLLDLTNQGLLYIGIRQGQFGPDQLHPFGYGRSSYFWSLVSAMGIFWIGCVGCIYNGINQIFLEPTIPEFGWSTAIVLGVSFLIDFSVFYGVIKNVNKVKSDKMTIYQYVQKIKDPTVLAVLLEDLGATTGVIIASIGIALAQYTGNPIYDGIASILIGFLLGGIATSMIMMNKTFLIGKSVDEDIIIGIRTLLNDRKSIEEVYDIKSQWISPNSFMVRAEINFDGHHLAQILKDEGYHLDLVDKMTEDQVMQILGNYTEDITRVIEAEVSSIENEIREKYPEAEFIDLEPYSKQKILLKKEIKV